MGSRVPITCTAERYAIIWVARHLLPIHLVRGLGCFQYLAVTKQNKTKQNKTKKSPVNIRVQVFGRMFSVLLGSF